jgi:hypothetical protein
MYLAALVLFYMCVVLTNLAGHYVMQYVCRRIGLVADYSTGVRTLFGVSLLITGIAAIAHALAHFFLYLLTL